MSGNSTLTAIGTASVTATSVETNAAINAVKAAIDSLPAADVYTFSGSGTIPAPAHPGEALILPDGITGSFVIPPGYSYVVVGQGSTPTLTGGDASTTIAGESFSYTGNAGEVISGAGDSTIVDGAANARIVLGSTGSPTVTATGSGDTITAGPGAKATITATGNSDTFNIGNGGSVRLTDSGTGNTINLGTGAATLAARAAHAANAPAAVTFTNVYKGAAGSDATVNVTDALSVNELVLGTADTVNAAAGLSTIFGGSADSIVAGLGSVFFVGGTTASTVQGGSVNDTVFATSGQQFDFGSAQLNIFVGGTAASTINAHTGGGDIFAGSNGDQYNFGTGTAQVFIGTGGADTLSGAVGTVAPTIFATSAEHMTLTAGTPQVTVVSFANGGTIDTSATSGNNVIFAGYGVGGNQTLIGSPTMTDSAGAATHDQFIIGHSATNTPTSMTIDNWHGGDVFYLTGFTTADSATMDAAINTSVGTGSKANLSFTLSDKTTVTFVGNHPTAFNGNAAF